ncbi:MAG: hypothetical protein AB3N63_10130 [Puniceicoccaceae bacterium]
MSESTPEPTATSRSSIAPNSTLSNYQPTGNVLTGDDGNWYEIRDVNRMPPFLMTVTSDSDHWLFLTSSGAMTAGRINPENALFPYYTEDKIGDMSGTIGSKTLVRIKGLGNGAELWEPFSSASEWDSNLRRHIRKSQLGNHVIIEEEHEAAGLVCRLSWRPSEKFGFVRKLEIVNKGEDGIDVEILDGLCNIMPPNLGSRFQNEFSILGNAYKQCELAEPEKMGLYHLSSVPTDLAEPMECLKASVVWQAGVEDATYLLAEDQVLSFRRGQPVTSENGTRGKRGCYLVVKSMSLEAGSSCSWYICADVNQDLEKIEVLRKSIREATDLAAVIEADCGETDTRLRKMLSSSDGLQLTAARRRSMRHASNTLFNLMRGGVFTTGYDLPVWDVKKSIYNFNRKVADEFEELVPEADQLSCADPWDKAHPLTGGSQDIVRLMREYLPLSFSRRHGDPSRPWNKFSIEIKETDGSPRFTYQGNWRDIFQNWETLLHSFPEYSEAAICRFLNASTADGYNPYRLTKEGFDWEIIEPNDPWANIGYWGDHQIVYLLRLLETSVKFHPGRLSDLLQESTFVYAEVPYRIRPFADILSNPRETVDYDNESEARINERVASIGADGKLLHTFGGELVHVSLMEKLLNPLLSKLANFIPGGGIWMNTQRPEWNDANNALVGNGISVVTLGYISRYMKFLLKEFAQVMEETSFEISAELAGLLAAQADVFSTEPKDCTPQERMQMMEHLGQPASDYRSKLYSDGHSGETVEVSGSSIKAYLESALKHADQTLLENKRPDSLWHSYNLLRQSDDGALVDNLYVMLEGQVSILSAGLLGLDEVMELLGNLRKSPLYRADQNSYTLYPNRDMPAFLEKNRIPADKVESSSLLKRLTDDGDRRIVSILSDGTLAFNGSFQNKSDLESALGELAEDDQYSQAVEESREAIVNLFEETFNHHAFTGRSGTFFAYEGLGSIYWHMVSKLVLAVQECYLHFRKTHDAEELEDLLQCFRDLRDGIGVEKNPSVYGAFPTDAYSHTPAHAGAQQPGMTGQVKEDVLVRLSELGVVLDHGCIQFNPLMLEQSELLQEPAIFQVTHVDGADEAIELGANSLAFTLCQVPVVYISGTGSSHAVLEYADNTQADMQSTTIPAEVSKDIFLRTGKVRRITVHLP